MVKRLKPIKPKNCIMCNELFHIKDWQKPYSFKKQLCCSRQCNAILSASYCIGKKAHNNQQVERTCLYCKKIKMVSPAFADRPYFNSKCMANDYKIRQKGENHWHWMGGITEQKSRDNLYEGYKEWRKLVYSRDNYTCRQCSSNESGKLNAHHIKPVNNFPELILEVGNGLTVCTDCHKEIHYAKV